MMRPSSAMQKFAEEDTVKRLHDMLSRVAMPCEGLREEASAPARDFAALIERLSREVDETVLPRRFALLSDAGMEATFTVSNRRLVGLEIGERKIDFDEEADTGADSVARLCAQALRALNLRSGPLRLRPIGRAPNVTTKGNTCTARHLADYSSVSIVENRLKAFVKLFHAHALGWVYQPDDGQTVTHDPDEEIMARLRGFQQAVMSRGDGKQGVRRVERSGPICSAFAMTEDTQVLIAEDGNDRLFAAFRTSELGTAMTKWHQVFKRPEH